MRRLLFLLALLCVALFACDDEPAPSDGGGGGAGAGGDGGGSGGDGGGGAGGGEACTEFSDPHLQLLNAPTTAQVERKVPTHPPVGAEGLP